MQDFQTTTGGYTAYRPWRDSVDDWDYCVRGTGDEDDDHDLLTAAVTALNAAGKGTLVIEGEVKVKSSHDFVHPINIRGRDSNATINITNTSQSWQAFRWNYTWTPSSETQYVVSTAKPLSEYITSTTFLPNRGDYVCVYSEDLIADAPPHSSYEPRPMELHQVAYVDSSTDRIYVSTGHGVVDQLTTTPKMLVVPMMKNVTVRDLNVKHTGGQGTYATLFYFVGINGLTVENIRQEREGGGSIWCRFCANIRLNGLFFDGMNRYEEVYGVTVDVVNGFHMCDSVFRGTRHPFTTTAGMTATGPYRRYGTPINCTLDNLICDGYSKRRMQIVYTGGSGTTPARFATVTGSVSGASAQIEDGYTPTSGSWAGGDAAGTLTVDFETDWFSSDDTLTFAAATAEAGTVSIGTVARNVLSTHPEGYGIRIANSTITVAGDKNNSATWFRSRKTEIVGCTIRGSHGTDTGNISIGVDILAADCSVRNCRFENLYHGVYIFSGLATVYNNHALIEGNSFYNCNGPAILISCGDNHRILNNFFESVGRTGSTNPAKCAIQFGLDLGVLPGDGGTGHIIANNVFKKDNNTYSIYLKAGVDKDDITLIGNTFLGYSGSGLGLGGGTAADVVAFDAESAPRNLTDRPSIVTLTAQDATPATDGARVLITANTLPTEITGLDGGYVGQRILLCVNDASTVINHMGTGGTQIALAAEEDTLGAVGDVFELYKSSDTLWREVKTTVAT